VSESDPTADIAWPKKAGELQNHHMDSTRWNDLEFRDDDIVIATWAKTGTTWTQQIVSQLIFEGAENIPAVDLAPWVDLRFLPFDEMMADLDAQTHRRMLKTHLPLDALVFSPKAKYIYIGRDGRDVLWSFHHHHSHMTPHVLEMLNDIPGRVGPPLEPPKENIVEYFHDWLGNDGFPLWPFWAHIQGWWDARDLPNVLLLHFNDLKTDMPGGIRRIAEFLEIDVDEAMWPTIIEHCTFDYMKTNAPALSKVFDESVFRGGLSKFINKGTNGRWHDRLSAADIEKYERVASNNLSSDCAHWLATAKMPD
jgi:aryl sulfotransferase